MEPPYQRSNVEENDICSEASEDYERSDNWARLRRDMHDAIDRSNWNEVEKCLDSNGDIRQWLHPETEKSALCSALEKGELRIAALLMSRNCSLNEKRQSAEGSCFEDLSPMHESEFQYQLRAIVCKRDAIANLVSKSWSKASFHGSRAKIKMLYETLGRDEAVRTILDVASTSPWLEVILDFHAEKLNCMLGSHYRNTWGLTYLEEEKIYIGAMRNDSELLGTMAHEFCHLALKRVYENDGKPYKQQDSERCAMYEDIFDEIKLNEHGIHHVIREAFDSKGAEEAELIVRVPHILAMFQGDSTVTKMTLGESLLREQVPKLFEFFMDYVIPKMKDFVENYRPERDAEEITRQNERLEKACKAEKLGIQFRNEFHLQDTALLVLKTSNVAFLEVVVNDAVRLKGGSYVFLETSQWDCRLQEVLVKNKCDYVILSSRKENVPNEYNEVVETLRDLSEIRNTKVIVLAQDAEEDQFAEEIKEYFKGSAVAQCVCNIGLDDVTEECKENVLKASRIRVQENNPISITRLIQSRRTGAKEHNQSWFLTNLDETAFLKFCNDKEIGMESALQTSVKSIPRHYIHRTFKRLSEADIGEALRANRDEAFAFVGCNEQVLSELSELRLYPVNLNQVYRFERCVILGSARDYKAITQLDFYKEKTVHLMEYNLHRLQFRCVKSHGSSKVLLTALFDARGIRAAKSFMYDIPDKLLVICGEPGMGKSAMSLRMAQEIKALDNMMWVVHVNLPLRIGSVDLSAPMNDINITGVAMLATLCDIKLDTFEFKLFKESISCAWPFKCVVLFDAFDEVGSRTRTFLTDLLLFLETTNITKIFLFSRMCFKSELRDKLGTKPLEIMPFKEEEQVVFLKTFWRRHARDTSENSLDSFARRTLRRLSSRGLQGIVGNPLLIHMIAELHEPQIKQLKDNSEGEENHAVEMGTSILDIYEEFVEGKFEIYYKEKVGRGNSNEYAEAAQDEKENAKSLFYESHSLLAFEVIFKHEWLTPLLSEEERKRLEMLKSPAKDNPLKHGLVDGYEKGSPVFVHFTFAEFFAARHLLAKIRNVEGPDDKILKVFSEMYCSSYYTGVVNFLDEFGAKRFPHHRDIMKNHCESVQKVYLNIYDDLGRSALHIAALHAHEATLTILATLVDKDIAEELLVEDKLGMTPFQYGDRRRALQTLNVFCSWCSGRNVDWTKQLPTTVNDLTTEKSLWRSGLSRLMLGSYNHLLSCLLKVCFLNGSGSTQIHELPAPPEEHIASERVPEDVRWSRTCEEGNLVNLDSVVCDNGCSPIFHALSYPVFKALLPYSNVKIPDVGGWTLLHVSAAQANKDACKVLIVHVSTDACNAEGQKPLHVSALCGHSCTAEVLIAHSTTRALYDRDKNNPLHLAVRSDTFPERQMSCECLFYRAPIAKRQPMSHLHSVEMVKSILPHVEATAASGNGDTALHLSSAEGFWTVVVLLLPYSNVDAINEAGDTPLVRSVRIRGTRDWYKTDKNVKMMMLWLYRKTIKLLLLHSHATTQKEHAHKALHLCVSLNDLEAVKLFLPHSCIITSDRSGRIVFQKTVARAVSYLTKSSTSKIYMLTRDEEGWTPTHSGALLRDMNIVKNALIFAPLNTVVREDTILHICAAEGHSDIIGHLLPHLSVSIAEERRITPLQLSAKSDWIEVTKVLLPHSDPTICDMNGGTALDASAYKHSYQGVKLLLPYSHVNGTSRSRMAVTDLGVYKEEFAHSTLEGRPAELKRRLVLKVKKLLFLHLHITNHV